MDDVTATRESDRLLRPSNRLREIMRGYSGVRRARA